MVISAQQIRQIETIDMLEFPEYMGNHILKHFPTKTATLPKENLSLFINTAIEQAKDYQLFTRYEVCLFTDILVMLGSGCFSDLSLPWLKSILFKHRNDNRNDFIEALYDGTTQYLDQTIGKGEVFAARAYEALHDITWNDLNNRVNATEWTGQIWPAKYFLLDDFTLREMVGLGRQKALEYGLILQNEINYFTLIQFVLGHQFYIDPLLPTLHQKVDRGPVSSNKESSFFEELQQRVNSVLHYYFTPTED